MPAEGSYETSPEPCLRTGCDALPWQPCQFTADAGRMKKGDLRRTLHSERRSATLRRQEHGEHEEQPPPVGNGSTPIVDLVVTDLEARKAHGITTYGVPLQAFNGRDAGRDAYEEAMDLTLYLRQDREERENLRPYLDEVIRTARTVVSLVGELPRLATEPITDLAEMLTAASRKLDGAVGRYAFAHAHTGQPPIPDANENYDHRRSDELARQALANHPRDTHGRLTTS